MIAWKQELTEQSNGKIGELLFSEELRGSGSQSAPGMDFPEKFESVKVTPIST